MKTELLFRQPDSVRDVRVPLLKPRRHGSHFQKLVVIHSRKNDTRLRMSPNLLDFCLMLERRPDIRYYQPTPYTLIQPSRAFCYTPAVCVYGDAMGLVFFETTRFMSDGCEDQLVRHEDWIGERDYMFCPCQPYTNISYCERLQWRYLYSYSFSFNALDSSLALETLKNHVNCTLQELLDAGAKFSDISYQLFYGEASADLRFPITRTTAITLPSARS